MSDREVMKQALEALGDANKWAFSFDGTEDWEFKSIAAVAALKTALEQPEQEPTPWRDMIVATLVREGINKHRARELADHFAAQPEPVACRFCHDQRGCWTWQCYHCGEIDDVQKPTPPAAQRPWVGLTDEEVAIASAEFDTRLKLAFHSGMYKAQIILRKKNDSTY